MAKKKKKGEKFIGIYKEMYISRAFQDLSPNAIRVLMEFKWRYNGHNNGEIGLSLREITRMCKIGTDKSFRAILELLTHGFIKIRKIGMFSYNEASVYELTFQNFNNRDAKNDWRYWPDNDGNKIRGKNLDEYRKHLDEYLENKSAHINQPSSTYVSTISRV